MAPNRIAQFTSGKEAEAEPKPENQKERLQKYFEIKMVKKSQRIVLRLAVFTVFRASLHLLGQQNLWNFHQNYIPKPQRIFQFRGKEYCDIIRDATSVTSLRLGLKSSRF